MEFFQFIKKIEQDSDMQIEIKACLNKKEFIQFLKKYNAENLFTSFEERSRDLGATYWPWRFMGRVERKNFFK